MAIYFQPTEGRIVSEVIDGEAILLDLTTGSYFSADHVGAAVWSLVSVGVPVETTAQVIADRFEHDLAKVTGDVEAFVDDLYRRGLIQRCKKPADEASAIANLVVIAKAYEAPQLAVYEDMQDLLFIDPIHDVGEAGWPLRKETA
ncbi:PqqD family protein [Hyphomicrobium sp. B1]|uniref:PqqD family protein n=1 Tax=Hyphomicrobium sp. B1 TaxID=3075651 RepID=UPI003C3064B9